jgi:hypothetical protein
LSFRGNIVVQRLVDAAGSFELPKLSQKLAQSLAALQDAHTSNLFSIGNELLERTLLNADFHAILSEALRQDGFDLSLLDEDPLEFLRPPTDFGRCSSPNVVRLAFRRCRTVSTAPCWQLGKPLKPSTVPWLANDQYVALLRAVDIAGTSKVLLAKLTACL